MTVPVALAGMAASVAALAYLAATDPMRRRAFRLPAAPRRCPPAAAWAAALLPGALVGAVGGAGGFFVWLGATSVLGWGIAVLPPRRASGIREELGRGVHAARGFAQSLSARSTRTW